MINFFLGLAFLCAVIDWYSVHQKIRKLEGIAKPSTMIFLISWVFLGAWQKNILDTNLRFFIIGLSLCLVGDILLFLTSERFFVSGLIAFLLGHISYMIGFGGFDRFSEVLFPFIMFVIMIVAISFPIIRKLLVGLKKSGKERLILPVIVYAVVICSMLGSAGYRFFDSNWTASAAYLLGGGALIFFVSDVLNAWERFVNKFKHDRLIIMVTYHLGQFGLATGVVVYYLGGFPK